MKYKTTKFEGLVVISHKLLSDNRGYFKESFRKKELESILENNIEFCQENIVKSKINVLRGLHFQKNSSAQAKLVTVIEGDILDIAVDIRKNSNTYGKYFRYLLSSNNHESLFIPKGFAHGYITLSKNAIIKYEVDNYFNKNMESGIAFDDNYLNIDWMIDRKDMIISQKDLKLREYNW
jgi:dTDP-4-dehydrorhamnose 3,5-epimerase